MRRIQKLSTATEGPASLPDNTVRSHANRTGKSSGSIILLLILGAQSGLDLSSLS